jgi:Zn-dependent protease
LKDQRFIILLVGMFVVLRVVQYVIAARIFLTSAIENVVVLPCSEDDIPAGDREVLRLFDAALAEVGLRPLGYLVQSPFLTYYGEADHARIFVDDNESIVAHVTSRIAPEYGSSVNVQLITRLTNNRDLVTTDMGMAIYRWLPGMSVETMTGASLSELVTRHRQRLAALNPSDVLADSIGLDQIAFDLTAHYASIRQDYRRRGWCSASNDCNLDLVTLRGAFGLVQQSKSAFGRRGTSLAPVGEPTDANRHLRAIADFQCVRRVARTPRNAPGIPWPLIGLMGAMAVASLVGMAALWNLQVSLIIFFVILIHEGGHVIAMRAVGHSDVHVFFVPLLGALTIGRSTNTRVKQRIGILLAGPIPGFLFGVACLWLYGQTHNSIWKGAGFAFLLINALNLLPIVPLDGGRVVEVLTRPEGITRFLLQVASSVGLVAIAFALKDPVFAGLAVLSVLLLPRYWLLFRFRRALGQRLTNRQDWLEVVRTALVVMTEPAFSKWRSPSRQVLARATADQFVMPLARPSDWLVGVLGYFGGIMVLLLASVVWVQVR